MRNLLANLRLNGHPVLAVADVLLYCSYSAFSEEVDWSTMDNQNLN